MASIQPQTNADVHRCWNFKVETSLRKEPSELSAQSGLDFPSLDCSENDRSDHTGEKRAGENA